MRRFLRMAADGSDSLRWSKVGLAKEVLAELPSQMLEYFERTHMTPCHTVPGQPKMLQDLADPAWWRAFTQPEVIGSSSSNQTTVNAPTPSTSSVQATSSAQAANKRQNNQDTSASYAGSAAQLRLASTNTTPSQSLRPSPKQSLANLEWNENDSTLNQGSHSSAAPLSPDHVKRISSHQLPGAHVTDDSNPRTSSIHPSNVRRQMSLGPAAHSHIQMTVNRRMPSTPDPINPKPSNSSG
ncbi:hypothetical protein EG68_00460 [Paragonimus skrjabini miyazakii]|uniref:Uncharacterized protein n=1 Tax=Paragonimus skrjabini miyazakii TaxID=59628 RepID=A0A8S9Z8U0_9TREM|nr:hypothetical protein EG68_00460 [Paragonimus skrjabini miyazakii]